MNKLFIIFAGFIATSSAISDKILCSDFNAWKEFKWNFTKHYPTKIEEYRRMDNFIANKQQIDKHNKLYANGISSFKMGINTYSDLTTEEFTKQMNGVKSQLSAPRAEFVKFDESNHIEFSKSIDWRDVGAVSSVKDQGNCSSCWAHAAIGAVESQMYLINGNHIETLSEQNLIDCSSTFATMLKETRYWNRGCKFGYLDNAYYYIMDHGIDKEKHYPYTGEDNSCKYTDQKSNITISGIEYIESGDEEALCHALATVGPISAVIDASHSSFQHYESGIYFEPKCNSTHYDHAVLIVGYGTDEHGQDYYIVKNSWGTSWGEDGYFRIARNYKNHCGIATQAMYPIV